MLIMKKKFCFISPQKSDCHSKASLPAIQFDENRYIEWPSKVLVFEVLGEYSRRRLKKKHWVKKRSLVYAGAKVKKATFVDAGAEI